ncbi:MAG: hypothetical protein AB7H71_17615 [Alphaproteobacteria bacterium]
MTVCDRCPWPELPVDEVGDDDAGDDVAAGEDGLAVVADALDVPRAPPAGADVEVFWGEVPDVGFVVSAMKSSANPTGKTSRKPCVENNRDDFRFHPRWTGKPSDPACNKLFPVEFFQE